MPPRLVSPLVCSVVFLAILAGCAGSGRFETVTPNPIFRPLDLPTPTSVRTAAGAPGPDYWQQRVDYTIDAALDAETNAVTGRARVVYANRSPDALDYLWLHLEQNVFREGSVASQIASTTSIGVKSTFGAGCTVESITTGDGSSVVDLEWHEFDALARVDLPEPLPAGGTFTFDMAWNFTIPEKVFRRFGIEPVEQGTIYEVAQWFPAVAVYDDVYGWNALPYLGTGEFYTNFGTFDVTLTVPRDHLVVATGVLQNPEDVYTETQRERLTEAAASEETVFIRTPEEVDDPATRPGEPDDETPLRWHFVAENVRTFAWASSDAFILDACGLDDCLIQSAYPKEKVKLWADATQMLRTAIAGYNERWYRYPYPSATNVYGAEGGMEYPMLIFCRGSSERGLYGVTTHEIGHNWFPMVVNTDERRHAWMDEGFNTFVNYYSFGEWFEGEFGRRGNAATHASKMLKKHLPPIETIPDHVTPGLLGELQYEKTAVGLVLLREQVLGPERFDFAFRTYIERWAFKSPRPADFFRTMDDAAGGDLAWFWRGWFLETATLDQAVRSVTQTRPDAEGKRSVTITIDNRNDLVMPVVLEITYADRSVETKRLPVAVWFNRNRYRLSWKSDQRVVRVVIDPERKFPDVDRLNDTWTWRPY